MQKIGIYAGTFDPVHDGHIAFAQAAIQACGLSAVVFLPEPEPRGKRNVTDVNMRLRMLHAATQHDSALRVAQLPGRQFSVAKTLPLLQQQFGAQLWLLVGSDIAPQITTWPGADALFAAMHVVVGMRSGDEQPQLPVPATFVPTAHGHIAASHIRNGQVGGISPKVAKYIHDHGLYRV